MIRKGSSLVALLLVTLILHQVLYVRQNLGDCLRSQSLDGDGIHSHFTTTTTTTTMTTTTSESSFQDHRHSGLGLTLSSTPTTERTFTPDPFFQRLYEQIDDDSQDEARCARYNFTLGIRQNRRIFFGALVTDETGELVRMHAAETYGLYHTVALVESNSTFSNEARKLRFGLGGDMHELVTSGIFGADTNVFVDVWYENNGVAGLLREQLQRESIIVRWHQEGMGVGDIGLIGDIDETFTRDFLRAVKVCERVHPNWHDNDVCHEPKIVATTVVYEALPNCIMTTRWFHPDMVIGRCIDGVGDISGRVVPERQYNKTRGDRLAMFGGPTDKGVFPHYRDGIAQLGRYPLWSTEDVRNAVGAIPPIGHLEYWGNGYHFHNFFNDLDTLRHKYKTYGHAIKETEQPLSAFNPNIDMTVRCVHNLPDHASPWRDRATKRDLLGLKFGNPVPLYFRNESYVEERIQHVTKVVLEDEEKYGSTYKEILRMGTFAKDTLEVQEERQERAFKGSGRPYKAPDGVW